MKKNLTYKQLKKIIKECACEAMKGSEMEPMGGINVISLGEPEMKAGLFPGMDEMEHHHDDSHWDDHDQGEKGMILSNLAKMSDKALELRQLAANVSDNEEWVQEKIAVASAMIDSIHNYLKYRK
jgi:hypothetical protein